MTTNGDVLNASLKLIGIVKPFIFRTLEGIYGDSWWSAGVAPSIRDFDRKHYSGTDNRKNLDRMDVRLSMSVLCRNADFFKRHSRPIHVLDDRFFSLADSIRKDYTRFNAHSGVFMDSESCDLAIDRMMELGLYIDPHADASIGSFAKAVDCRRVTSTKNRPASSTVLQKDPNRPDARAPLLEEISSSNPVQPSIDEVVDVDIGFEWGRDSNDVFQRYGCMKSGECVSYYASIDDDEIHPIDELDCYTGVALLSYSDGSYYFGHVENGLRSGEGRMVRGDRIYREGIYDDDEYLGPISVLSDGRIELKSKCFSIICYLRNGSLNGPGIITYDDGSVEHGVFCNNVNLGEVTIFDDPNWDLSRISEYDGQILFCKDGIKYTGSWNHGKREGIGIYKEPDFEYYGNWHDDEPSGYGTASLKGSGEIYKGTFANGLFNGSGEYNYSDGSSYSGSFSFGIRKGRGEFRSGDCIVEGDWSDDSPCGIVQVKYSGIVHDYDCALGSFLDGYHPDPVVISVLESLEVPVTSSFSASSTISKVSAGATNVAVKPKAQESAFIKESPSSESKTTARFIDIKERTARKGESMTRYYGRKGWADCEDDRHCSRGWDDVYGFSKYRSILRLQSFIRSL